MSGIGVRPFHRRDRDQLTDLVNAHAAAVVPGVGVSVATMLSHLERDPGEFIVDPWVTERVTLVAEQDNRVSAAAHLLRYGNDDRVAPAYRNAGEIRWLLFWPAGPGNASPWWTAGTRAAADLMAACIAQFEHWSVTGQSAGGELPVPGVYGVPEQWPHVSALYEQAGFAHDGHTEVVYLARVPDLARLVSPPVVGLDLKRTVGLTGTRLSAVLAGEVIGYIEVEIRAEGERLARQAGWADVGNLHVGEHFRRRKVATWLLGQAADWLELARVDRLLDYAYLDGADATGMTYDDYRAFLAALPFRMLTRTRRGWTRTQV
ncbi:MAG TPA: GNAT family N-acetyltransferase [Streptosporangiaceae bacterium]|nr:GNAT family N-acetyltransferase [Streptosporangiaceae bacterium]